MTGGPGADPGRAYFNFVILLIMSLITPPIKNISQVTGPLKEEILNGNVHTIDEMRAWLKPLGYSDTINEAAINFILREFVMSKVSSVNLMNMDMVVDILRPQLEHQPSYFSHQTSQRLYHYRNLIGSPSSFIKANNDILP